MEICISLSLPPLQPHPRIINKPHSVGIGVGVGLGLGLGQCKHTIR